MLYEIKRTNAFKRELKNIRKRGLDMAELDFVVDALASGKVLPSKYCDHALKGKWRGSRECHVAPDWLLIYKIKANVLVLTLQRTGTHSDLF